MRGKSCLSRPTHLQQFHRMFIAAIDTDVMELGLEDLAVTLRPLLSSRWHAGTRDQHDAIEQTLQMMDDDLSHATHQERLEQFFGFYKPLEVQLFKSGSPLGAWLCVRQRRKTALLEADLKALGQQAGEQLPGCIDLPALSSAADFFGCLDVLEGASLGGVSVSRHVQIEPGVTAHLGAPVINGYGERTGAMWQQFRTALTEISLTPDEHGEAVAAVRQTFQNPNLWCQGKPKR
jgi:heme oxygenase